MKILSFMVISFWITTQWETTTTYDEHSIILSTFLNDQISFKKKIIILVIYNQKESQYYENVMVHIEIAKINI